MRGMDPSLLPSAMRGVDPSAIAEGSRDRSIPLIFSWLRSRKVAGTDPYLFSLADFTHCIFRSLAIARCCNYSYICSWWWVELSPETCRAVYRNINKLYIVASCWTIIDIDSHCTDPWTLKTEIFCTLSSKVKVLHTSTVDGCNKPLEDSR
jgi:hypothetical protein